MAGLNCHFLVEAWSRSVSMKLNHPSPDSPTDVILPVIAKVKVMAAGTTADNERDFAHNTKHFIRTSRGITSNDWRASERQLSEACSGKSEKYLRGLALDAQKIWLQGFSAPRQSGANKRMNWTGLKNKKPADPTSLSSFEKLRRRSVAEAVSHYVPSANQTTLKRKAKMISNDEWGANHDKKESDLKKLQKKRRFECQKSKLLLAEEKMPQGEYEAFDAKQKKDDVAALKKHLSVASAFEKKMKSLEQLVGGQTICLRRLPPIDEQACQQRLPLVHCAITL